MARNDDLNNLNEGLRRLQEYEQTLKRIESLAKSIATLLNSSGDKSGLMGNLQQLQTLRVEASTGGVTGGSAYAGLGFGATNGMPLANAGAGVVSDALMTQLDRSRARQQQNAFNPFAGGGAVGPSSTIGTPGYGYNAWYFQQMQSQQTQRQIGLGAAGLAASHFISSGLSNYARNTSSGDYDPMQGAAFWGGGMGATIGGALGFFLSPGAPGAGAATGMLAGQMMGTTALQAILAPQLRQRNAELALQSVAARQGGSMEALAGAHTVGVGVEFGFNGMGRFNGLPKFFERRYQDVAGELDTMQHDISSRGKHPLQVAAIEAGVYTGRDIISLGQISEAYASLGSGLLASGEDSSGASGYTRNLASKYFMGAPEMAKMAAPVFAARSRFDRNNADLLMNFGPEAYGAYQDALGGSDLTPRQLTAYGNIQRQSTRAQIASLQTRGAAAAALGAVNSGMQEMAALPGGTSSLAYAQLNAQARGLGFDAFQTEQIGRFALPMTELSGRMARANLMPFGSGNQLSMQFENIGLQRQRIGDLESFRRRRRASGQLSEQEELSLSQQIEESRNSIAGSIGMLGEGRENLLPGLTAGATRYSGRFTSASLAALSLAGSGSPIRSYGAVNGRHLAQQDSLWQEMGGAGFERPSSRSMALNNGRDSAEIVSAIKELTRTMERLMGDNGGGYARSGEGAARTQGALSRANLGGDAFANGAN